MNSSTVGTNPTTTAAHAPVVQDYLRVRATTEDLAAPLSAEDHTVQSMPDCSPTKWHRAHTTWFFETFVLSHFVDDYMPFDPEYGFLFNSYYEAAGPRHTRADRGQLSRPSIQRISEYRTYVDNAMASFLQEPIPQGAADLVTLGLQHESQHQELLLMDAKHMLAQNPIHPLYRAREHMETVAASPMQWVPVTGGIIDVGHNGDGFSFDNELPRHEALVPSFEIGSRLVTAGEWLDFMADGGYSEPRHWLSEGWATVNAQEWTAPEYWHNIGGQWQIFTLDGLRPVDPAEPVCHVSLFEADAYASWAGARLATEFEWELAAAHQSLDGNLLDHGALHPTAALAGHGLQQLFGDVWEWTASAYLPYPGFVTAEGAVGEYNGKFMSNQHVLRGGCALTPADHVRSTYRNFYPANSRWAMTGVRLVRDAQPTVRPTTVDVHLDAEWSRPALKADVRSGLGATPKTLPPKWFYDEHGSDLYDQITRLDEYYPARTESSILVRKALAIAQIAQADTLIELGSGTSEKTGVLLDAMQASRRLRTYVPFDVAEDFLRQASTDIASRYPGLNVHGVVGDFEHHLGTIPTGQRNLIILLGGTIGNFTTGPRAQFLAEAAALMQPDDYFLLGTDLVKDVDRLEAAYDDAQGVTAAFNKNVLAVINRELNADFDLDQFAHRSVFDTDHEWIEMRLRSLTDQTVTIGDLDMVVHFEQGEEMRTEVSSKFRKQGVADELAVAGLEIVEWFTDPADDFGLSLSRKA